MGRDGPAWSVSCCSSPESAPRSLPGRRQAGSASSGKALRGCPRAAGGEQARKGGARAWVAGVPRDRRKGSSGHCAAVPVLGCSSRKESYPSSASQPPARADTRQVRSRRGRLGFNPSGRPFAGPGARRQGSSREPRRGKATARRLGTAAWKREGRAEGGWEGWARLCVSSAGPELRREAEKSRARRAAWVAGGRGERGCLRRRREGRGGEQLRQRGTV